MKKTVEYYLNLPYKIEILPVPKDKGGGYIASLPEVGSYAMVGDGETEDEALKQLKKSMRQRFSAYIKKGIPIPEPTPKKEEYSGRFVLRIPKSLHATLASSASKEGTSLNTHIVTLLSWAHCGYSLEKKLDEIVVPIKDLLSENKNEAVPKFPYVFVGEESITVLDQEKTEMFWGEVNESKH